MGSLPAYKHIEDGKNIGIYVGRVRQKNKKGLLSTPERTKFETLHGWQWDASHLQSSLTRENSKGIDPAKV